MIKTRSNRRQKNNDTLISLLLVFICCIGNISCTNQETASLSENSIIYCSEGSPETFNPQLTIDSTSIDATSKQFYNTLVSLDADSKVTPALAKSWHITQNGLMLTFYLRKNVTFHHTSYFTPKRFFNADDVMFSFNRILDPLHPYHSISGGNYPFFAKTNFSDVINSIEKINDHTVRFKLNKPDSSLITNLATDFAVILSKEYANTLTITDSPQQLDTLPIGTGPFKFKNYRVGSYIRYLPHESYWAGSSHIKQLVFDITPSNTGRLTKLLAGECDIVNNPIAHQNIQKRSDLILNEVTSLNVRYLALNTAKAPLDNPLIRQALQAAINKQQIVETLFFNQAEIAQAIIPPNSWAYPDDMPSPAFTPEKALEKLAQVSGVKGLTLSLLVKSNQGDYNIADLTMAEMIASDLAKHSITVVIDVEDGDQYDELPFDESTYDMVLHRWTSEHSDPNNFFTPLLSCDAIAQQTNITQWCNTEYQRHIEQALHTRNITKRKAHYKKALNVIFHEVPLIPISHAKHYVAQSEKISGNIITAFGGINFLSVRKN